MTTFAYQWTRDGSNIGGATSKVYTSQNADIGFAIGCTVTATNASGSTPQASSNTITASRPPVAPVVRPERIDRTLAGRILQEKLLRIR
jgi:hypothetical protein